MKKIVSYSLALSATVLLAGCSGKMNQFKSEYFSANPNPLEVVGQEVPATVSANVPAKFFKKNASVTITPVLVYEGTEQAGQPVVYQGEKVRGNAPVVSYDNGGNLIIPVNYVYTPAMDKSELYMTFNVEQGKKQYVLPRVKVADGVIATAALADAGTVNPATANDAFQRIINQKYNADIMFLINQANVRKNQLTTDQIKELNAKVAETKGNDNLQLEEINISSYASPDGALDFNEKLAENREKNTLKYLEGQLKKDKMADFSEITKQWTAEDWNGFKTLVEASDIQDKALIIRVLNDVQDPELREEKIRELSHVFDELADEILPQLRRSIITASINVIGKSDEEINQLFDTDPSKLNVEELLYCATLTNDNARKEKIYSTVVSLYPNDFRGYNNLAKVQYLNKQYAQAKANIAKAAQLAPAAKEVNMNSGLLSLVDKDFEAANRSFGNAAGLEELSDALGVYYLTQGDNAAAVKTFGKSKTNNAALAQILTKDYAAAKSTLAGIANPDATTYYLTAVLGARTNNESMVRSNLEKAIKLNPAYAAKAKKDLEFAKYNF